MATRPGASTAECGTVASQATTIESTGAAAAVAAGVYDKYVKDTNDTTPTVIASTASPYKFTRSVMEALGADTDGKDDFALADELSALSGVKLPQAVETIRTAPVLHNRVVDAPDMPKAVKDILGIR